MPSESSDTQGMVSRGLLGFKLVAGLTAVIITSLFFFGYAYLRNRHLRQSTSSLVTETAAPATVPTGPAQVSVLVDDAMLKAGETTIGGTVRNISEATLNNVTVELELYPRTGKTIDQAAIKLEPAQLEPQQEGRYVLKVKAKDYSSVRLVGVRAGADLTVIPYTSSHGRKRPPERIEPEIVPPNRLPGRGEEFLNTPDNPARVP